MTSTRNRDVTKIPLQPKRGRPPLDNPLSGAERARRYRARKKIKAAPIMDSGSEQACSANAVTEQYIADLRGGVEAVVEHASKGKRIPADILVGLLKLLDRTEKAESRTLEDRKERSAPSNRQRT